MMRSLGSRSSFLESLVHFPSTISAVLIGQMLWTSAAFASPDENEFFPAKKIHPIIWTKSTAHDIWYMPRMLFEDERHAMRLKSHLSTSERSEVRRKVIYSIEISEGADIDLLNDPTLFPHLKHVGLYAEKHNATYIASLVSNYPQIKSLFITQRVPLQLQSVRCLEQLHKLQEVSVECEPERPSFFLDLPKSIRILQFAGDWRVAGLPKLTELRIEKCRLPKSFFEHLHCPRLNFLKLAWIDVPVDGLNGIDNLRDLTDAEFYHVRLSKTDRELLRQCQTFAVRIQNEHAHSKDFLDQGEKYLMERDFDKALRFYEEVFAAPSYSGYKQRAKCYTELNLPALAQRESNWATDIEGEALYQGPNSSGDP